MVEDEYLLKNRHVYDLTAEEFGEKIPLRAPADALIVAEFERHVRANSSVLELGPGSGYIAHLLSQKYRVTAIEFSERMAQVARRNAPGATIITGEFLSYDFGMQKFDGIMALAFIHLFPGKRAEECLAKMRELLTENGIVLLSTTAHDRSEEGYFPKSNFAGQPLRFRRRFTRGELERLLSAAGFQIVACSEKADREERGKCWMQFVLKK